MSKVRTFLAVAIVALLSSCAPRVPKDLPPYDEMAYRPFAVSGTATVSGGAFLVTKGGDVKKAAGRKVFLIPETPFLLARMNESDTYYPTFDWLGWSGESKETIARASVHTKVVVADVEGKFEFEQVPGGKYIVETQLFWQYMYCGFLRGCSLTDTGDVLRKHVELNDGAVLKVLLTSAIDR